jgi:hypothetical protein
MVVWSYGLLGLNSLIDRGGTTVVAVCGAGQGEAQVWDLHGLSLMMLVTGCWIGECLLERFLEHRIADQRILRLIRR